MFEQNVDNQNLRNNKKKISKYYSRFHDKNNLIYNFVCMLNFNQKTSLYKIWNKFETRLNNFKNYETTYKKKFKNYFRKYYEH